MIGVEVYETSRFPLFQDSNKSLTEWRFRIRAVNGEIVAQSEGYTTKAAAEKGVRALRRALLPGTRDAEAMAKAWDKGFVAGVASDDPQSPRENPYREEIPRHG